MVLGDDVDFHSMGMHFGKLGCIPCESSIKTLKAGLLLEVNYIPVHFPAFEACDFIVN